MRALVAKAAILPDVIPPELVQRRQWVAWRWADRDGKLTKPPVSPRNGQSASTTDPTTWSSWGEAAKFVREHDWAAGIGFVFSTGDEFAGVDLDACRDPATGALRPWAQAIIDYLDSYSEVSPSGTGVKVFLRGTVPAGLHKGFIELYDRGRYFTVTGLRLQASPESINSRDTELNVLFGWLRGEAMRAPDAGPALHPTGDDQALLKRAREAANGSRFAQLWDGDWSDYQSQSEADLALACHLAFWTGNDPARIDRLFRQSGLYREKWDERHYGDGRTYGQVTVERAMQGTAVRNGAAGHEARTMGPGGAEEGGAPASAGDDEFPLETDLGNAVRLARHHGQDIHYCFTTNTFYVWSRTHWPPDDTGEIYRRAKETARSIFREAEAAATIEQSKRLAQHAVKSQGEARIAAMVKLLRSEPGIPITPAQLDADPWLFNVLNGTIDLRTCQLRPHRRQDLIAKVARVRYDPDADCPLWLRFLDRIMAGNTPLICFLQKAVGYSLTADVSEQVVFFLQGTGANGKSTFISTALDVMGDYGKQAAPGLLTMKKGESHPTELADLAGARFVASVEVDEGRRLAEALTKWLTGGDRIKARFMRQDFFEFPPTHKLWLAANHRPAVVGTDHAIWRRLRLIPFEVVIPDAEQDKLLGNKLRSELSGILNWILEGCRLWQKEGLVPPSEVTLATKTYREEQDTLNAFLQDCCEIAHSQKATAKDLYGAYRRWCDDNGEIALSQKALAIRLSERGLSSGHRGTNGQRWWKGVGLVTHRTLDSDTNDG